MSATDTETLAENFASLGRDELVSRFRDAYTKALGVQSDLVSFDAERVEAMVQRAVAEADGLQWRRALAGVAARELGIELGPALTHPAVARAHQLVAAPSYESALAALAVPAPLTETPPPAPAPPAAVAAVSPISEAPAETAEAPITAPEPEAEAIEAAAADELAAVVPDIAPEPAVPEPESEVVPEPEPEVLPEPESEVVPEPEPEVLPEPESVVVPEPESAVEVEPESEPQVQPEPELDLAPDPEPVQDTAPVTSVDQPTMSYDAVGATRPDEEEPVQDPAPAAGPRDDALAHRAADFAEEFMAGDAAAPAIPEAEPEDDFTFEQDAVELPADSEASEDLDVAEFGAVHLGGVATLPSSEEIAVRLSEEGLDLIQPDGTIVGRLGWTDIAALEVTVPHGGRRRRRGTPRLVVHTAGGSARFEVPGLSGDELQDQVQPLMARYGQ